MKNEITIIEAKNTKTLHPIICWEANVNGKNEICGHEQYIDLDNKENEKCDCCGENFFK